MEFRKRDFRSDNDNNRNDNRNEQRGDGFNRDNNRGGGFNRDDNRDNRGGGFNRNNDRSDGGGGFQRDFNRPERPPRPQHDLVHSTKIRAGKRRTYFFDVRKTEMGDHYMTVTESTQKFNGGYERHKVFLYKEDFNRFVRELTQVVEHIKTDLQPDYDYDEFERRQLEWEEQRRLENENAENDAYQSHAENAEGEDPEMDDMEAMTAQATEEKVDIITTPIVKKETPAPTVVPAAPIARKVEEIDDDMSW